MEQDNKQRKFTLQEMIECWETAQDSWAKECGADGIDDIEDEDYTIPINSKQWFKDRFGIEI